MKALRSCFSFALLLIAPLGMGAEAPLASHFADQPADSLIRQLEPGPGGSVEPADAGLVLKHQTRWLADLGFLLVESTLVNEGKAPATAKSVRLADWTFRVAAPGDGAYRPLAYRDDTWYGSTYWTGPDWTRVGKDWQHPGENTPSVRCFTCPRDGKVTIAGRAAKAHVDPKTDGVRLSIRLSLSPRERVGVRAPEPEKTLWQAELDGGDAKGVEPAVTLDVHKGDAIRFVVHKRGQIFCDTTRWDPVITYADGESFVASKGFSTTRQGEGGWSYEMEGDGGEKAGLPTLHTFWTSFLLRQQALSVGANATFSSGDVLPVVVLADGSDRSGIALSVSGRGLWRLTSGLAADGHLRVEVVAEEDKTQLPVERGATLSLPRIVLATYQGSWPAGMAALHRALGTDPEAVRGVNAIRRVAEANRLTADARMRLGRAWLRITAPTILLFTIAWEPYWPELDLLAMVQADWRQQDKLADTAESYAAATRRAIANAAPLIPNLPKDQEGKWLAKDIGALAHLAEPSERNLEAWRGLYFRAHWLKRQAALANPLLPRAPLLFVKRVPTSYSHLVMQYFGWRARPGGGLFALEQPGRSLLCRDLLGGKLASGNILEPRLSWNAQRVVFSYSKCTKDDPFYHIYEMSIDGSSLRQLTSGEFEDLMPCYLPDGGIVFSSTRRQGHARCFGGQFGPRWHVYTLHRMDADGSNIRTLSFHETNEWFPTVAPSGDILYSRWDYVDRHPVLHQNLWACRPDGTNPVALWGNHTETPHCTFQLQPIPGTTKVVFTASAHHSITGGSIAIVDTRLGANGEQALTRITPEIRFPEAEGGITEYYDAPWPLSEDYFLVGYSPKPLVMEPGANDPAALGIYLLDRWGNRELLYRDPEIGSSNAIPLVPRPVPPILGDTLPPDAPPTGELVLLDVYQGLGAVPRGSVKALRIVQILPKTTPVADAPRIGLAGQEPARAVLGTVPVEADGSARFTVPARKPLLFQALDADGFAVQTMRSITYAQPGERTTCIGCHESRTTTPGNHMPQALLRPPSAIEPGPDGTRPFSYARLVQPMLDKHCVKCHSGDTPAKGLDLTATPHDGFTRSYWALCGGSGFWQGGTNPKNAAEALVPRYGGWNPVHRTEPGGAYGARGSRLMKRLLTPQSACRLLPEDLARLALWIDCNSVFYGTYDPAAQARQLRGEAVEMPEVQ